MRAEKVAQALVELFSRFGVPKEICSDQGSSFKLEVVTKVEELGQADVCHFISQPD